MDHFKVEVKKEVNEFLEKNICSTHEEWERIQSGIRQEKKKTLKFNPVYWTVLVAAASLFLFLSVTYIGDLNKGTSSTASFSIPGLFNNENQDKDLYEGKELSIGVLGNIPKINEKQINFQVIEFEKFTVNEIRKFDAVFVMKESLSTAAEKQYTKVFTDSNIPFFFLNSNKGAYPFIDENLEYEEAREIPYHDYYATGYLATVDGEEMTWTYEGNKEKNALSNIFKTIESVSSKIFRSETMHK